MSITVAASDWMELRKFWEVRWSYVFRLNDAREFKWAWMDVVDCCPGPARLLTVDEEFVAAVVGLE